MCKTVSFVVTSILVRACLLHSLLVCPSTRKEKISSTERRYFQDCDQSSFRSITPHPKRKVGAAICSNDRRLTSCTPLTFHLVLFAAPRPQSVPAPWLASLLINGSCLNPKSSNCLKISFRKKKARYKQDGRLDQQEVMLLQRRPPSRPMRIRLGLIQNIRKEPLKAPSVQSQSKIF